MVLRSGWAAYLRSLQTRPLTTKASAAALIFFASDAATQFLSSSRQHSSTSPPVQDRASSLPPDGAVRVPPSTPPSIRADKSFDRRGFLDVFQPHRSVSAACFGVVAATWLHYWWNALEALVASRLPLHASSSRQRRLANALVKVVIDQALAAPLYTYGYYVITNFVGSAMAQERLVLERRGTPLSNADTTATTMQQLLVETHAKARDMLIPTMVQHYKLWPAVHLVNFYAVPLQHRVLVQNSVLVFWSAYLSHLNHHTDT